MAPYFRPFAGNGAVLRVRAPSAALLRWAGVAGSTGVTLDTSNTGADPTRQLQLPISSVDKNRYLI